MAQVRETIELLAKLLRANGTSKIKAETFRLAKFNNDEAVEPLWKLLFDLLYFCKYRVIDEVTVKAFTDLTTEELVVYVKQEMQQRGFFSRDFAGLPNNMSSGSRELLLAFGWLICKESIVDGFMEKCATPLQEDGIYELPGVSSPLTRSSASASGLSPKQKVQQLQLLNGKLRLNLKCLYSLKQEQRKLQHTIHECTEGVILSPLKKHLSAMEVHILRHPELLKKILRLLEKDNERLQNMLDWKIHEEVFWKWMESVLELKMTDAEPKDVSFTGTSPMYYNIPPDAVGRMEGARRQLEQAILKYETIIDHLEDLWDSKRQTVTEQELDNLLSSINMEISWQEANLTRDGTQQNIHVPNEPHLTLVKNITGKKSLNVPSSTVLPSAGPHGDGIHQSADIQTEIASLEGQLQCLQMELNRNQFSLQGVLEDFGSRIPEAVCIQPRSCR